MSNVTLDQAIRLAKSKASRKGAAHCVRQYLPTSLFTGRVFNVTARKYVKDSELKYIVLTVHADGTTTENENHYFKTNA